MITNIVDLIPKDEKTKYRYAEFDAEGNSLNSYRYLKYAPGELVSTPTPLNRKTLMAMQGFTPCQTTFLSDGSIKEVGLSGTKYTYFNSDGSITETFKDNEGYEISKKIIFNGDGSIIEDVNSLMRGNLFNSLNALTGMRVINTTGAIGPSTNMMATEFIPVTPNKFYTFGGFIGIEGFQHGAFYDANKNFISGIYSMYRSGVVPKNAKYMRYSIPLAYKDTSYITEDNNPKFKNELSYNPDTWAEWSKSTGVVRDSTGLEIVTDGTVKLVGTPTNLKTSTKYGLLLNFPNIELSHQGYGAILLQYYNSTVINLSASNKGNNKFIFTTGSIIPTNKLDIKISDLEPAGSKIKIKDIRIYELPTGSQIETDFNTLTADQLATKYLFGIADVNLRSLPNGVEDTISGKMLTIKVGEVVLNGSENWIWNPPLKSNTVLFYTPQELKNPLSNNFPSVTGGVSILDYEYIAYIGNYKVCYINISKSKLIPYGYIDNTESTYETAFKAWLRANPTTVLYELATPVSVIIAKNY